MNKLSVNPPVSISTKGPVIGRAEGAMTLTLIYRRVSTPTTGRCVYEPVTVAWTKVNGLSFCSHRCTTIPLITQIGRLVVKFIVECPNTRCFCAIAARKEKPVPLGRGSTTRHHPSQPVVSGLLRTSLRISFLHMYDFTVYNPPIPRALIASLMTEGSMGSVVCPCISHPDA